MKKKLMQINRKIAKTNKAVQTFFKQTLKNYTSMKTKIKSIWLMLALFIMCSCGSTKVSVDRPSSGTMTTITVTTNNPITTDVNPSIDAKLEKGK